MLKTEVSINYGPIQETQRSQEGAWEIGKEIALTSIPFLALYKPLSFPVALGAGSLRTVVSAFQLADALQKEDAAEIFSGCIATTVAVTSLAGTLFAHPVGVLVSTTYDVILEIRSLVGHFQEGNYEEALLSCLKVSCHLLYFMVFLYGGPEMAICFLALQIVAGIWGAHGEFTKGNYVSGIGHALMASLRSGQLAGQAKMLQVNIEIERRLKTLASQSSDPALSNYVGKLAEKWQFPSDHLPVGAKIGNVRIISWNVLNNHFIQWVTEIDSQGLDGSMISKLHEQESLNYPGITLRDELIGEYILYMIQNPAYSDSPLILSLQECSPEFVRVLSQILPSHMGMILVEDLDVIDHNVVIYDAKKLSLLEVKAAYPFEQSDPIRSLTDLSFIENATGEKYHVFNVHIPGDPTKPGREEFARYVLTHLKNGYSNIALGDMNFTEKEMQDAFDKICIELHIENSLRNLSYYNTNIHPFAFTAKSIDHIWTNSSLPCKSLTPNEILSNLQETVDLLHPREHALYLQAVEAQKIEELKKWYRRRDYIHSAAVCRV